MNPPAWLGHLATALMLVLLAWLCASIYWSLALSGTGRPPLALEDDPLRLAQAINTHRLFGLAGETHLHLAAGKHGVSGKSGAADTLSTATGELRLTGAIAAAEHEHADQAAATDRQAAYALITIEGGSPVVVREGDEVVPGIVLRRVQPRSVELLRNGVPTTLSLPDTIQR